MKTTSFLRITFTSLLLMYCASSLSAQGIISTIAGTGGAGFGGDGGPAISAYFYAPSGVALDPGGNIYIADKYNSRIRMIDASTGNISTVAGSSWGYYGMGGPAISALFRWPNAIFVDDLNNYYFTDWYNDASMRVDGASHDIRNDCGHDCQGYSGDGGDGSDACMEIPDGIWKDNTSGDVYICDAGTDHIRRLNGSTHIVSTYAGGSYGYGGDYGPVASASFNGIDGICTDNLGNVYIADGGNNCIRMVDTYGIITTIAGTGAAGYSGDGGGAKVATLNHPGGLFINNARHLFICDKGNNVVRVLDVTSGNIFTLAGNGTAGFSGDLGLATAAQLDYPTGVWQDATGTIYIADANNNRIRKVIGSGFKATPNAGIAETATATHFNLYPNPSNGVFTIETNSLTATVEVYNVIGAKVFNQNIISGHATLTIDQPAGVYTVIVKSETGKDIQKVVIR